MKETKEQGSQTKRVTLDQIQSYGETQQNDVFGTVDY